MKASLLLEIPETRQIGLAQDIIANLTEKLSDSERVDILATLYRGSDKSKANYIVKLLEETERKTKVQITPLQPVSAGMPLSARIATLLAAFFAVVAVSSFVVIHYLLGGPPTIDFSSGVTPDTGATVHVVMQEDPQNTVSTHPDWVSYFIRSPQTGQWVHTTLFEIPAGSRIDMTVYGYDGCSALRNPYWGKVTGTIRGVEYVDGKSIKELNSWGACNVAHTFSIPGIGLSVPMASPDLSATLCGTSPCTTASPHRTMTFSFLSPKQSGQYQWQCFIPCGGGFLDGNGGPMQTIGFMTGSMTVVS